MTDTEFERAIAELGFRHVKHKSYYNVKVFKCVGRAIAIKLFSKPEPMLKVSVYELKPYDGWHEYDGFFNAYYSTDAALADVKVILTMKFGQENSQ